MEESFDEVFFDLAAGTAVGRIWAACGDRIDAGDERCREAMYRAIRLGLRDAAIILAIPIEERIRRLAMRDSLSMN